MAGEHAGLQSPCLLLWDRSEGSTSELGPGPSVSNMVQPMSLRLTARGTLKEEVGSWTWHSVSPRVVTLATTGRGTVTVRRQSPTHGGGQGVESGLRVDSVVGAGPVGSGTPLGTKWKGGTVGGHSPRTNLPRACTALLPHGPAMASVTVTLRSCIAAPESNTVMQQTASSP